MDRLELLASLCLELRELKQVAAVNGKAPELESIVEAARRGEPIEEGLRELGLLSILASSTSRGMFAEDGQARQYPSMTSIPGGLAGGRLPHGAYRCPERVCLRSATPAPGDDLPTCAIHGRALRFEAN
jgi:hypothetical protein